MKDRAITSVKGLRQIDIFTLAKFAEWYTQNIERFPNMKIYIHIVDYLRFLAIQYLENCVMPNYNLDS
jgi:hypothetical protein